MPRNPPVDQLYENWKPIGKVMWWGSLVLFGFLLPTVFGWFELLPGLAVGWDVFRYNMVNVLATSAYIYVVTCFHALLLPPRDFIEYNVPDMNPDTSMHREFATRRGHDVAAVILGCMTLVNVLNQFR